jgi:aminoglycoside 3'-phosphotransferase-2
MSDQRADMQSIQLPYSWQAELASYRPVPQTAGKSAANVFRLEAPDRPTLFVKTMRADPQNEIASEVARLRWLADTGIPCPRVLAHTQEAGRDWLLMSRVRGANLVSGSGLEPARIVAFAAEGLRKLHQLEIASCPFDGRTRTRIEQARIRMEAGLVDEDDFDDEHRNCRAETLFERLEMDVPENEELVVAHGDAGLSNLLADCDGFSGFVDCARLGVADRHQDLSLTMRDIAHGLGEEWLPVFLGHYGIPANEKKNAYFRLLDEFF